MNFPNVSTEQLVLASLATGCLFGLVLAWFSLKAKEQAERDAINQAKLEEREAMKRLRAKKYLDDHRKSYGFTVDDPGNDFRYEHGYEK